MERLSRTERLIALSRRRNTPRSHNQSSQEHPEKHHKQINIEEKLQSTACCIDANFFYSIVPRETASSIVNESKFSSECLQRLKYEYANDTTSSSSLANDMIKFINYLIMVLSSDVTFLLVNAMQSIENIASPSTTKGCQSLSCNMPHVDADYESESSCDDSIADPNFVPSDNSDSDCDNAENDINEEIHNMGLQIEENLVGKRKMIQIKRNSGQAYVTRTGIVKKARSFTALTSCRKKCQTKISVKDQEIIFFNYWASGNYSLRVAQMSGLIDIVDKKSTVLEPKSKRFRRFSCKYHFQIHGENVYVCKKCFLITLGETDKFLRVIIDKKMNTAGSSIEYELRGKHTPANKIPEAVINDIKAHINLYPAYESHYTRRDTSKKYLPPDLNISIIYRQFCSSRHNPVSITKFSEVFHSMDLKFKSPKLDTCNTCEILKSKIDIADEETKTALKIDQQNHHLDADKTYKSKEADKIKAKDDHTLKVYSFDLQQCLPTPYLNTNISFYKRSLWTYNLTVHDCYTNQPFCFMWHEAIGNRGGNEIASCILKKLQMEPTTTKHVVLYSDNCPGQNKNTYVSSMLMSFLQSETNVEIIDHKFMVVGHSHMECDTDHSVIERKKKKTQLKIHSPRDWFQFVRTVGTKSKFIVHEMNQADILDFGSVFKNKILWRTTDTESNKFSWRTVRWLRYTKEHGIVRYKNSLDNDEEFKHLNVKRRGVNSIVLENVSKAYNEPIKISKEKKKDLLSVLPLIDPIFHDFYKNLVDETMLDYHPDLTESAEED